MSFLREEILFIVIFFEFSTKLNLVAHPNVYLLKESQHFLSLSDTLCFNSTEILVHSVDLVLFCSYAFVYYVYVYIWYIISFM